MTVKTEKKEENIIVNGASTEQPQATEQATNPANETTTLPAVTVSEEKEKEAEEQEQTIDLDYMTKEHILEVMEVPSHSKLEHRMVTFLILWARRNKIEYEFDSYGNVYLKKGELDEGEFYPCVTSHMDTVHSNHDPYIYAGVPLKLKITPQTNGKHKLSVDSMGGSDIGIGADCKAGIAICLAMFKHLPKLKACFFLDEETGCHGSSHLDEEWFKDVGYVIGYDSPELTRAAWACSSVKLFPYDFYEKHMKAVCDLWGLTKGHFYSEPYTDVKEIRQKTHLVCMNFGNGGYNAHVSTEYCIMEEMDHACGMGIALIQSIGNTRHICKETSAYASSYVMGQSGDDIDKLKDLGDNTRYGRVYSGGYGSSYGGSNTSRGTTVTTPAKKEDEINFEVVKYIVNRYDGHIDAIKSEILEAVKELCFKKQVEFDEFEEAIVGKFSNDITF